MKRMIINLLILGLSIGIVGCGNKTQQVALQQFEVLSVESTGVTRGDLIIVKHKETSKKFIIYNGYRKGGICPLD